MHTITETKLSKDIIRAHYNKLGSRQDRQNIYENPALNIMLSQGEFDIAGHVFELGCGTGKLALRLFKEQLGEQATYTGLDISSTMIELTRKTLKPFAPRVKLIEADGTDALPIEKETVDRFVSAYVFDIFSKEEIEQTLNEAHRIIKPNGLICLASLGRPESGISGTVAKLWSQIHNLNPKIVGGCQPIELKPFLDEEKWQIEKHESVSAFGIASEMIIAERL